MTILARALWDAGDHMLTAGSYLGDAGWSNRGENPAVLGMVGISIRNAAEGILEGEADWSSIAGELEEAAAGGGFYFPEEHWEGLLALLPQEEDEEQVFAPAETWSEARAALRSLASDLSDAADRVKSDEVSSDALQSAADGLEAVVSVFRPGGLPAAGSQGVGSVEAEVEAELAAAGEERSEALRHLALRYHPDQNHGMEARTLPKFLYVQRLRQEERSDSET